MTSGSDKGAGGAVRAEEKVACALCGAEQARRHMAVAAALRHEVFEHIRSAHPEIGLDARICKRCMGAERVAFLVARLEQERGELSEVEDDVARKAAQHLIVAEHIDEEFTRKTTAGQRVADRVAAIGGSWPFLAIFFALLAAWMAVNVLALRERAFDPYPFILLNLVLSCLAAVQAPIIMMSQNRLAARDRAQADLDFRTNLKAEIEIAALHEKMDHLLHSQFQRMVEVQEIQLDLLNEIAGRKSG